MKRILALIALFCASTHAQTPPIDVYLNCVGGNVVIIVVAHKPGNIVITVNHDICGSDI